jgi:hypothetical protein
MDDVADAPVLREPLVVVVVARQNQIDPVALEERHPAARDARVARVLAAGVGGVVEGDDLPARARLRQTRP